jgi:signal transduction histidine kinase
MAGGIAHDFNNLLTGILGNASLASDMLPSNDKLQPILAGILKSSELAAELISQILAYTGRAQQRLEALDLSEVVGAARPVLKNMAGQRRLEFELATNLPLVRADRKQITRVIKNLTSNAIEALPAAGGAVMIRTSACEIPSEAIPSLFPDQDLRAQLYVSLQVCDNGVGIPDEVAASMFDPFFTTKFLGRGLGLSAVQGVVRAHHGGIRVSSSTESGTQFEVILPADQDGPPA